MKKIRMNCAATLDETFADFLLSRRAKRLAGKTLESYSSQWKAVVRHLDKVFQSLHYTREPLIKSQEWSARDFVPN